MKTSNLPRLIAWAISALTVTLVGCEGATPGPQRRTELMLGTAISVTVHDQIEEQTFDAIFDRIGEVEQKMSTSESDYLTTELLRTNRNAGGDAVSVSPDTLEVVQRALEFSRRTRGAFEVSIQPLVDLWGIGTDHERVPGEEEIADTLRLIDYTQVEIDPFAATISLGRPGMGVDVGGIAKGYAADEAARMLRADGVAHALLDFGGNIYALGHKPDGSPWRIGIQRPFSTRGEYIGIVRVSDLSVVTSGVYERSFTSDGVRYHHILDPSTGRPARTGLESVTVVAAESIVADALSTAVFVLGLERGFQFVENQYGVEAAFVTEEREIYLSSGMEALFEPSGDAYRVIHGAP